MDEYLYNQDTQDIRARYIKRYDRPFFIFRLPSSIISLCLARSRPMQVKKSHDQQSTQSRSNQIGRALKGLLFLFHTDHHVYPNFSTSLQPLPHPPPRPRHHLPR